MMKKGFSAIALWVVILAVVLMPRMANGQDPSSRAPRGGMQQGGQRPGVGGRIKSIDKDKNTIVVESRRAGEFTILCDENTKYSKDDASIKFTDLKEGDFVMVRGEVDADKKTAKASEVAIRTAPPQQRPN